MSAHAYGLSALQQGILFHSSREPAAALYVDQLVYRLRGDLDVARFTHAWQRVTDRHEALRTGIVQPNGDAIMQRSYDAVTVQVTEQDWRQLSQPEQDRRRERYLDSDRAAGFDLTSPPPYRLSLLRTADDEYTFVVCYHHVLIDAWSAEIMLDEALHRYDALVQGTEIQSCPARPYGDYLEWLRERDTADAEQYWRATLSGFTAATPLPAGINGRRDEGSRRRPEERLSIPESTTQILTCLARNQRLTLGALIQTAWGVVLARHSGQDDVVFGATIASRPTALGDTSDMVGLLISTLPLRLRLNAAMSFVDCAAATQRQQAETRTHAHASLTDVQRWSDIQPGEPLFNMIMTFLNVPGIGTQNAGSTIRLSEAEYRYRTNYPLVLLAVPGDELTLQLNYAPETYDAGVIRRLLGHLAAVLTEVAADPTVLVRDIVMLSSEERAEFETANATQAPLDARCFHEVVADNAAITPDAVALSWSEGQMSYGELDRRANQLAHHLRSLDIGPESLVALSVRRRPEFVVALLGILKAGGAYLPIDPAYPQRRIDFMLADSACELLVAYDGMEIAAPDALPVLSLAAHAAEIASAPTTAPLSRIRPDNAAYAIYTSGSTGVPKGVVLTHAALRNSADALAKAHGIGSEDRFLQWASPSYDASVLEAALALTVGATLCLAAEHETAPGPALHRMLSEQHVTGVFMPPSAFSLLPPDGLPELRTVILGGEPSPGALVRRWRPGRRVFNLYGPTECTVWVAGHEWVDDDQPLFGPAIHNARLYVLDAHGRELPIGAFGELCVGGLPLARGYLGRPAATAERFIPDPWGQPGARMYRTGDLVRRVSGDRFEFAGRLDRQVKVRGFRIETGEIEAVLNEHPEVSNSAVVARDGVRGKHLVAYVLTTNSGLHLRTFLQDRLPAHMIPAELVPVSTLPLTPNGKLDEAALPVVDAETSLTGSEPAKLSDVARSLAEIWADVLDRGTVNVEDDFFELGGDSLVAMRVAWRIHDRWGVELSLETIFTASTLGACATELESSIATAAL